MKYKMELQKLVRINFESVAALSKSLGWSYSKTYRIVTGRQIPNVLEAWTLAQALGLETAQEMWDIFRGPDQNQAG